MRLQFWQKPVPQELSQRLRNSLATQFNVDPQALGKMRVTRKNGHYSSRRVDYIRIFDPSLVVGGAATTLRYDDLQENNGHRKALLFEGHIEKSDAGGRMSKDAQVHLRDRRAA